MRINMAVPDRHITPELLNAALEVTSMANERMLAAGEVEPVSELIKHKEVRWKPEPFKDGEHFDLLDTVQKRGWGDCDDLSPALTAELRHKGIDEGARSVVRRSGPKRWHVVTELSDGTIVDPSEAAGMYDYKKRHGDTFVNGGGPVGVQGGAILGMLTEGSLLGVKPYGGGWAARCDLPVDGADMSIVGVSLCRDPHAAMQRAVDGACLVGAASGLVTPEDLARAIAVNAAMQGHSIEDVERALAPVLSGEEVGSLFGSIFKGIKSIASPVTNLALKAAKFVPIPGVSQAADLASSLLHHGGGGGGHGSIPTGAPGAIPPGAAPGLAAAARQPVTIHMPGGTSGPLTLTF
jgi:hypothetical protein